MPRSRDHALDDDELLVVLEAKHDDVGGYDVEQTTHDRSHAVEMARPARTAKFAAKRRHRHPHGLVGAERIDLALVGHEHRIDRSGRAEHREILVERTRIRFEVFACAELGGIDEDRRDDDIGLGASQPGKAQVPIVQIPHRRHESDALP